MRTVIQKPSSAATRKAARLIRSGELVAFPTETVYGLGANALDVRAIKKIFKAKGRPSDNPLIVHVAFPRDLDGLVKAISPTAKKLIGRFWPGPLTLLFRKSKTIPDRATAGLKTVAVRCPSHPVARKLIRIAGVPLAAPSANRSGKPSPTTARDVKEDLNGKITLILDGGPTRVGLESTVIDATGNVPILLRPGAITVEQLERVVGKIRIASAHSKKPRSPGMKYRHYAPKAKLILAENARELRRVFSKHSKKRVALVTYRKNRQFPGIRTEFLGATTASFARRLFATLRTLDRSKFDVVVCETPDEKGLGFAIMNRLKKAATS